MLKVQYSNLWFIKKHDKCVSTGVFRQRDYFIDVMDETGQQRIICEVNEKGDVQWAEIVSKPGATNPPPVDKKIIGYRLIKPLYKEAVKVITDAMGFDFKRFEYEREFFTVTEGKLKDAGVLDLWFTPVYQDVVNVGDNVIILHSDVSAGHGQIGKVISTNAHSKYPILVETDKAVIGYSQIYCSRVRKATSEEIELLAPIYIDSSARKIRVEFHPHAKTVTVEGNDYTLEDLKRIETVLSLPKIQSIAVGCTKNGRQLT